MKVLYILETNLNSKKTDTIGGITSHVGGVIEAFYKRGDDVVFISPSPVPFLDKEIYKHIKLEHSRLIIPKLSGIWNNWRTMRFVMNLIRQELPDLIYTRWPGNVFFYRIRKKFPKIPIIAECNTARGMNKKGGIIKKTLSYFQDKQNLKCASVISSVSDEIPDYFKHQFNGKNNEKIIVNPNGVNSDRFSFTENNIREKYNIPATVSLIGFTGYFAPWHKIDILIKAVQLCKYDVRLLIVGKGPEPLETKLKELGTKGNKERIIFTGVVSFDRIPEYLSACDILVVPQDKNRPHGSSIKLFEYMSMSKAIAAANVGQLAKVIKDGENGMLFEPEPENLAYVLERLIEDESLRKRLGVNARKDAEKHYSWDANIDRIMNALPGN